MAVEEEGGFAEFVVDGDSGVVPATRFHSEVGEDVVFFGAKVDEGASAGDSPDDAGSGGGWAIVEEASVAFVADPCAEAEAVIVECDWFSGGQVLAAIEGEQAVFDGGCRAGGCVGAGKEVVAVGIGERFDEGDLDRSVLASLAVADSKLVVVDPHLGIGDDRFGAGEPRAGYEVDAGSAGEEEGEVEAVADELAGGPVVVDHHVSIAAGGEDVHAGGDGFEGDVLVGRPGLAVVGAFGPEEHLGGSGAFFLAAAVVVVAGEHHDGAVGELPDGGFPLGPGSFGLDGAGGDVPGGAIVGVEDGVAFFGGPPRV